MKFIWLLFPHLADETEPGKGHTAQDHTARIACPPGSRVLSLKHHSGAPGTGRSSLQMEDQGSAG